MADLTITDGKHTLSMGMPRNFYQLPTEQIVEEYLRPALEQLRQANGICTECLKPWEDKSECPGIGHLEYMPYAGVVRKTPPLEGC